MKVEYKGHKILRGLDGVDMRHLRPAAIITGKHEEKQLIDKVIAKSGYVGCVFDDDDGVHGIVTLDGKRGLRRDMQKLRMQVQKWIKIAARFVGRLLLCHGFVEAFLGGFVALYINLFVRPFLKLMDAT